MNPPPPVPSRGLRPAPVPLAQRLVRALCLAGFAIGLGSALQTLQPFLLSGSRISFRVFGGLDVAYEWIARGAMVFTLTADVLLLTGLAGEWIGKRWARPLLVLYACVRTAACLLAVAARFAFLRHVPLTYVSFPGAWWGAALRGAGSLLAELAYPALLLTCLRWPETRRAGTDGRAFAPVMPLLTE